MNKRYLYAVFGAALALGFAGCSDDDDDGLNPANQDDRPGKIEMTTSQLSTVDKCNNFGFRLLNVIGTSEEGDGRNIIISPISATYAFSMLANGADGATREQITNALGYDAISLDDANELNKKLNRELGTLDSKVTLKFANSIWARPSITVLDNFISSVSDNYDAEVRTINENTFVKDINDWCSSKTNGHITDFLPKECPLIPFALYNATYFKGIWTSRYKFDNRQTREGYFNDVQGSRSVAKYMKQEAVGDVGSRFYGETETMQKCELSFGNSSFGAAFILPAEGVSISQAIENLANGDWEKLNQPFVPINECCRYISVELTLPKFKIESEINFNGYLTALGMEDVVGDNADYSNMTLDDISIEMIKQKATFEIDEEGAVAAAVTGTGVDWSLGPLEYEFLTMTFDRPFIYVVYEHSTGAILFAGCVTSFAN